MVALQVFGARTATLRTEVWGIGDKASPLTRPIYFIFKFGKGVGRHKGGELAPLESHLYPLTYIGQGNLLAQVCLSTPCNAYPLHYSPQ